MPSGDETERKRELWGEEGEVEERAVRRKEVHCGGMVGCYLSTDFLLGGGWRRNPKLEVSNACLAVRG